MSTICASRCNLICRSLDSYCKRGLEPVKGRHLDVKLPEHECFILSPASFWRNESAYQKDTDLVDTILKQHSKRVESPLVRGK